jgi:uncharacterized protein
MTVYRFYEKRIPEGFFWLNEPAKYYFDRGLYLITDTKTDFWQRTHYGFRKDDGHCLLTRMSGDFSIRTEVEFSPTSKYDQCGLFARIDTDNWIKASMEYENPERSRLGSVVTNFGYSDWASQDVSSDVKSMFYRLSRREKDILIEYSKDDTRWHQMRVAHLHTLNDAIEIGVYACSPVGDGFQCKFPFIEIGKNTWAAV